jgi:hypothetical protein
MLAALMRRPNEITGGKGITCRLRKPGVTALVLQKGRRQGKTGRRGSSRR